jgi:hypothetical protein
VFHVCQHAPCCTLNHNGQPAGAIAAQRLSCESRFRTYWNSRLQRLLSLCCLAAAAIPAAAGSAGFHIQAQPSSANHSVQRSLNDNRHVPVTPQTEPVSSRACNNSHTVRHSTPHAEQMKMGKSPATICPKRCMSCRYGHQRTTCMLQLHNIRKDNTRYWSNVLAAAAGLSEHAAQRSTPIPGLPSFIVHQHTHLGITVLSIVTSERVGDL